MCLSLWLVGRLLLPLLHSLGIEIVGLLWKEPSFHMSGGCDTVVNQISPRLVDSANRLQPYPRVCHSDHRVGSVESLITLVEDGNPAMALRRGENTVVRQTGHG